MATDGWYLPALENFAPNDGGSHLGPVTVGVLHTTESTRFFPNPRNYFGHSSYPHFTVGVSGGRFYCYQHISLRKAGRALKNLNGGVQTNREGVIQIEVVGTAANPFTNNVLLVEGVRNLMRWIESETEIKPQSSVNWVSYPKSYGRRAAQRLGYNDWREYNGWLGHQHVPENDHGDPGAINISALLPGGPTTPSNSEETPDMYLCKDPMSNEQFTLSGNTRRKVNTWGDYQEYVKKGLPILVLSQVELFSYPLVGSQ